MLECYCLGFLALFSIYLVSWSSQHPHPVSWRGKSWRDIWRVSKTLVQHAQLFPIYYLGCTPKQTMLQTPNTPDQFFLLPQQRPLKVIWKNTFQQGNDKLARSPNKTSSSYVDCEQQGGCSGTLTDHLWIMMVAAHWASSFMVKCAFFGHVNWDALSHPRSAIGRSTNHSRSSNVRSAMHQWVWAALEHVLPSPWSISEI